MAAAPGAAQRAINVFPWIPDTITARPLRHCLAAPPNQVGNRHRAIVEREQHVFAPRRARTGDLPAHSRR